MGVYAETSGARVICKDPASAEAVVKVLEEQAGKGDPNGNNFAQEIERNGETIYFRASSGRIQNLEWQLGKIWETIRGLEGVEELDAPLMVEAGGIYYSNGDKNE